MSKDSSNVLPVWGNKESMNLNSLLLSNIMGSQYFKVSLYEKKTYHEVVDEIYYQVKHLEPWERGSRKTSGLIGMCGEVRGVSGGGIVSTAFCLLYKLYTLKLTRKQVISLTIHPDSPYIRALGFMYIRYTQPPNELFEWFEEYLDDPETLDVQAGGGCMMTIGQMLHQWLIKIEWFGTLFPRIPVPAQKIITEKLREHTASKHKKHNQNYDYDEEQPNTTSSYALEMPETFGNVGSSSGSDRHKKHRSSRDDRSRSRSRSHDRHRHRYDSPDRHKSHHHHHHHRRRRSSSRDEERRHYHRHHRDRS